jgi:hypothetical protein
MQHEDEIRQNFLSLLATFTAAFPGITPPDNHWWTLWMQRYSFVDIRDAIQTLSRHHLKPQFTTVSTGKAITALLRDAAMRRAMTIPAKTGGQS